MNDVKDVAPEIIEAILKDFNERIDNPVTRQLLEDAKTVGADYSLAYRYAIEVSNCLNLAIENNLTSDILPEGKLYYNIAERLFETTLKKEYDVVTQITTLIQNNINKENGINIKAIVPKFDIERAKGIAKAVSYNRYNPELYNDTVLRKIFTFNETFTMHTVDKAIEDNAIFHSKLGLHAVITRIADPGACKWCRDLAGVYEYEDVRATGNPVFRRHANCNCIVLFKSDKDRKYSDVHKWGSYDTDQVDKMIDYSKSVISAGETRERRIFRRKLYDSINDIIMKEKIINPEFRNRINQRHLKGYDRLARFGGEGLRASLVDAAMKITPKYSIEIDPKNGKIGLGQGKYQIVYDIAGDYFRIFDITIKSKNYKYGKPLGLEKEELFNVTEGGKTRGRSKNEVNFVSHFDNTDTRR